MKCDDVLSLFPGNGLTTFLDIFERHRAPATRVIRFRCTPLSTAQELFSCMIGDLLPSTAPASQSAPSSGSDGESPIHDCLDPTMSKRDSFENIRILAPGDEGFSLLILEDVHLQLDAGGVPGTIWEIFRYILEMKLEASFLAPETIIFLDKKKKKITMYTLHRDTISHELDLIIKKEIIAVLVCVTF